MSQDQDFISLVRNAAKKVLDGESEMARARESWNARQYGDTIGVPDDPENPERLRLENGTLDNEGVSAQEIGSAIFATGELITQALADPAIKANLLKVSY